MIPSDKVPLREFDEQACLRYVAEAEKLIDQQLFAPWAYGELSRAINIPAPADLRYFARLKQFYEQGKWLVSDPFQNLVTGGHFVTFGRALRS